MRYLSLILVFIIAVQKGIAQQSKGLTIGTPVPDTEIEEIINYKATTASLSAFTGKFLILDFWATWCAPCIAAVPKICSLQDTYSNQLEILPITQESAETVRFFMNKRKLAATDHALFTTVVNDSLLSKVFSPGSYPHYVWIDKSGIVRAITGSEYLNDSSVRKFISGKELNFIVKAESPKKKIDVRKPLFYNSNLNIDDENLATYAVLTRYISDLPSYTITQKKNRISAINVSVKLLYQIAYGDGKIENLLGDKARIAFADSMAYTQISEWNRARIADWRTTHTYCYELVMPLQDSAMLYKKMRDDLNSKFGLTGTIEKVKQKCMVLTSVGNSNSFQTKGGAAIKQRNTYYLKYQNQPVNELVSALLLAYQYDGIAVIDETGYKGKIDIEINSRLNDFSSLQKELNKSGLDIKMETRETNILIINRSDR